MITDKTDMLYVIVILPVSTFFPCDHHPFLQSHVLLLGKQGIISFPLFFRNCQGMRTLLCRTGTLPRGRRNVTCAQTPSWGAATPTTPPSSAPTPDLPDGEWSVIGQSALTTDVTHVFILTTGFHFKNMCIRLVSLHWFHLAYVVVVCLVRYTVMVILWS